MGSKRRPSRRGRSRRGKSGDASQSQKQQQPDQKKKQPSGKNAGSDREKRYSSLDDFLGNDEIQKLPSSLKVSQLANNRSKQDDHVIISTNFEANGSTYFLDVHDQTDGIRSLTIMQSNPTEKGEFKRQRITLSATDLPAFLDELRKVIGFFVI